MKALSAKYYGLLPLFLLCGFYTFRAVQFPVHDFANYYFGGYFQAHGHFSQWIYFPYEFNKAIAGLGYEHIFTSFAPNTPFLALVFAPLSFLPVAIAKIIFNVVSSLLFVLSLKRLGDFYNINQKWFLLIPVLFFVPIKNELLFGQVYFVLFFLIAESWMAHGKEKYIRTGIFLALAILLKVFPVLLVLAFLFKKQLRPLVATVVSCSVLLAISMPFCGTSIWVFFFETILTKASNGEISEAFVPNYQSVFMFLKQLLVYDANENRQVVFNSPYLFSAFVIGFKTAIVVIGFYVSRKATDALFVLAYWILAMLLVSPYASTYGFVFLAFPFLALIKSTLADTYKIIGCALLFAVSNVPMALILSFPFPFSYLRLFALLLLFAVFLGGFYRYMNVKILAAAAVFSTIIAYFIPQPNAPNGHSILANGPILIYDYNIQNEKLTYFYWDENGSNSNTIPFKNSAVKGASMQENQVCLNGAYLTLDQTNKLKPEAISDNAVLFLSDADRGIGFYTLRMVNENAVGHE